MKQDFSRKVYWPSKKVSREAWVNRESVYVAAERNPLKFWEGQAENLAWFKKWRKVFVQGPNGFKWFVGGKLNMSYNCLERNISAGLGNKVALRWIPEPKNEKIVELSYRELLEKTNRFANALRRLGVKKGDVVGIYLPMIPEAVISMLACARIGAVHIVIFSAFASDGLNQRLKVTRAKVLITSDGYYRKGSKIDLIEKVSAGIEGTNIKKVICVGRQGFGRNRRGWISFEGLLKNESDMCEVEEMDSEDLFFILPESGTGGEFIPIMHTCGGYAVQALTSGRFVFDFHEGDVYWCTGDIGWITGHTYGVYSPLLNGVTSVFYEGALNYPNKERWAEIIEENHVNIFYTSPTAVRMFEQEAGRKIDSFLFKNLKVIATVGEPIDEYAWKWFFEKIGKKKASVLDTYWQTETGGVVISSLPGVGPFRPTFAGRVFPGVKVGILNERGGRTKLNETGKLVMFSPFCPGMMRGVYRDEKRYRRYFAKGMKVYSLDDLAFKCPDGMIKIVGRADDLIKISGHRMSTVEIENAVSSLSGIEECAIVGRSDTLKGTVPVVFVKAKSGITEEQIVRRIVEKVGPIAKPSRVYFVEDLPKTKSGKIVRGILRKLVEGEEAVDVDVLSNPESLAGIRKLIKED